MFYMFNLLLQIATKQKGCSGLTYSLDYIREPGKFDEAVIDGDVTVYVDAKSIMHVIGSTVDYQETPLSSSFTFSNPNVTQECGCGQSFGTSMSSNKDS